MTPGQADEIPDLFARYQLATFPADLQDFAENETAMRWKHLTGEREREFWRSLGAAQEPKAAAELAERPKLPLLADILDERDRARAQRDEAKADWREVRYERDKLRELLGEVGGMAANAPEDGDSFGVLEQIAMQIAAASVPDSTEALEVAP